MLTLTREVRFTIPASRSGLDRAITNSWGGWPPPRLDASYLALQCTIEGDVDATTGYLCNIAEIDRAIRRSVIKAATDAVEPDWSFESLLRFAWPLVESEVRPLGALRRLILRPTPQLGYSIESENSAMVELTRQFEFSASHRLHNAELSDEENRRLFGKCNNPHGHGHNYLVDVTVAGEALELPAIDEQVRRLVIDRLDHRNLNVEIDEFRELNPSVENIAIVVWRWLAGQLGAGRRLRNVRIYETPKTWADYRG